MAIANTRRITGNTFTVKRKRGTMWYVKLRVPDAQRQGRMKQIKRLLGPAWTERGRPPAGYFTAKLAEQELQAMLTDARRGTLAVAQATGTGPTFQHAVDAWVREIERRQRARTYVLNCEGVAKRYLTPVLGADTPVASITGKEIDGLRDELLDGPLSVRSVRKVMVMLHGILQEAARREWITGNPCVVHGKVELAVPSGKYNHLSVEEVYAVARAADDEQLAAAFIVAAFTGLRMGELRALRWEDVDFTARAVRVRNNYAHGRDKLPKSGKVRSLPMADQVAVALDGLSKRAHFTGPGDLVFANPYGRYLDDREIRQGFYSAIKAAKLGYKRDSADPIVFHDLRHTFGTLCASSGVPVGEIRVYMGHASLSTTEIYMAHAPKHHEATRLTEAFGGDIDTRPALAVA
jgi:integrase